MPVWLRPLDKDLGKGVAASGALATRMGLAGRAGGRRNHCPAHDF